MNKQITVSQVNYTFKVSGKPKKLIYYGDIKDAKKLIRQLYPHFCCESYFTRVVAFQNTGDYSIIDILSGKEEHRNFKVLHGDSQLK